MNHGNFILIVNIWYKLKIVDWLQVTCWQDDIRAILVFIFITNHRFQMCKSLVCMHTDMCAFVNMSMNTYSYMCRSVHVRISMNMLCNSNNMVCLCVSAYYTCVCTNVWWLNQWYINNCCLSKLFHIQYCNK